MNNKPETIEESIERIKAQTRALESVPKSDRKKLLEGFRIQEVAKTAVEQADALINALNQ